VIFVPQTEHSLLAKRLRENEEEMVLATGYKFKIVERAGKSLTGMLAKSNPWSGDDCGRESCLLCHTKAVTGKNLSQSCSKRNIVYETWCSDCLKSDDREGEERRVFKYIGETAKSAYERGLNHLTDRKSLDLGSHMLKHAVACHQGEDPQKIDFHMKVLAYHKSSFERQIDEAVKIQNNRHHHILNSKSEFNRSSIPRLGVRLGGKNYRSSQERDDEQQCAEEKIQEEMIRQLRKEKGKRDQRRTYKEENSAPKRRKLQEGYEEKRVLTENTPSVKRMVPGAEDDNQNTIVTTTSKKRRMNQMVIDTFFKTGTIVEGEICGEMSDRLAGKTNFDIVTRF
jgi:hypothetical protein